jgi:TetR/AcrR family transcriptional regulator
MSMPDVPDCDPDSARTRILREAIRLFGRQGYAATSVREVVEAAGVTKPTLYYYFQNKEDLFREAVDVQVVGLKWLVDGVLAAPGTVRSRLRIFLIAYVGGALQNPDSVRLMMASAAAGAQPRVDVFERTHVEILRLHELIRLGVASGELHPEVDATLAISMLVGAANALFVGALLGDEVPVDYADRILDLLYRGMAR